MPVNTTHSGYDSRLDKITRVRDFAAGEDVVKSRGEKYLPMLGGQTKNEYNSFKERGFLIPSVAPTCLAVVGSIMRRDPVLDQSGLDYLVDNVDGEGADVSQFSSKLIKELLLAGGAGYLVEYSQEQQAAFVKQYSVENIINYSDDYIVLAQSYTVRDEKDKFNEKMETEYLELTFDEEGYYVQNIWRETKKGWVIVDSHTPTNRGERLSFIPFVPVAVGSIGFHNTDPILLNLTNINSDQYKLSTDLRHGLHFTALPTFFVFGEMVDSDGIQVPLKVGPGSANIIGDTEARAELLEFTGAGLSAVKAAIDDDITAMASIGAKMLASGSGGVKSAETARIEASTETATLSTIANTVDLAANTVFSIVAEWMGAQAPTYAVNRDFIDVKLDPAALMALLKTWQSGGMSLDSFLTQLQKGELLPDGVTAKDEADRIDTTGSNFNNGIDFE